MPEIIVDNWLLIVGVVGAALALATAIAKKTKTKTDDRIVGMLNKAFRFITFFKGGKKGK